MGCWNETDTLGGAPISYDDEIKVIVYLQCSYTVDASGFAYPNSTGEPISFVFNGRYNDYGGIYLLDNFSLESKLFMRRIVELYNSGNLVLNEFVDDIHNILAEDFINKYIERGLVSIKTPYDSMPRHMGILHYNIDVYEEVKRSLYEDMSWENADYNSSLLTDCIDYAERFSKDVGLGSINKLKEKYPNMSDEDIKYFHDLSANKYFGEDDLIKKYFEYGRLLPDEYFNSYYDGIVEYSCLFDVIDIGRMFEDLISLNIIMDILRKSYSPQSGKGSQGFCTAAYRGLIKGIEKQIEKQEGYL